MKLSAIIIAKNAEDLIGDCLRSVSFCDEILVVDNKSLDKTVDIAKKFGAKVVASSEKSFSELRNKGLREAQGEWVVYVDADERISPSLADEIKNETLRSEYAAYKIKRKNFYLGDHGWPYIEKIERLFKKENLRGWHGELHESPRVDGKVGELGGFLLHYTHRNLDAMLQKTIEWSDVEARLRLEQGHPQMAWWRFPRVMITAFIDSYLKQGGWKAGTAGIIESIYQAFSIFVTYAKLWELQEKEKK